MSPNPETVPVGQRTAPTTRHDAGQIVLFLMLSFGGLGALVGLLIGLFTYAPTAPAAAVEVALPAGFVGSMLGIVVVAARALGRRLAQHCQARA